MKRSVLKRWWAFCSHLIMNSLAADRETPIVVPDRM